MSVSDAQKKASEKWQHEKVDDIRFRVAKGKRAVIHAHAEAQGESVNAFLNRAVDETMARDQQKPDADNN